MDDAGIDTGDDAAGAPSRWRRRAAIGTGAIVALAVAIVLPVVVFSNGSGDATTRTRTDSSSTTVEPAPVALAAEPIARTFTPEEAAAINNFAVANLPPDQQLQYGWYLMTPEEKAEWGAWVTSVAESPRSEKWVIRTVPAGSALPPGTIIIDDPTALPGSSNTGLPAPPVPLDSVWDHLAWCEASGNWATNTSSGYSGGLQFLHSTWLAYGGRAYAPYAWQASREQQIAIAERILADVGWRAWPACSRKLGVR